jgi:hypothetical protein
MAFEGRDPVGFLAVVPRRMRLGHRRIAAHLLSFLAVRPQAPGQLALAMLGRMREVIQETGKPVVTYPRPGSFSEKALLWDFGRAGFRTCFLGSYRTYGAAGRPASANLTARAEEGDEDEFLEVIQCCQDERILWSDPDRGQLRHYREDPRDRVQVIIRDSSDRPIGCALAVLSEVISPRGIDMIPMIDSIFLPQPSAEALGALVQLAQERWACRASSSVVTAPNLKGIDAGLLRAAGLRATPSEFQGYLFASMCDTRSDEVLGTNLEVV